MARTLIRRDGQCSRPPRSPLRVIARVPLSSPPSRQGPYRATGSSAFQRHGIPVPGRPAAGSPDPSVGIAVRPPWLDGDMPAYDAFLLVSFGGPEGPDDVMPFLQNVTRGRGVPPERLASVAEHYYAVGGVSPINQQCRDLLAAIGSAFPASGLSLPVYWGNRNWTPYLTDTVRTMAADGVRRAIALVTSAYSSYSSCRQYLEDIDRARAEVGPDAPRIDKIRRFFKHPGFIEPFAANTRAALATLPADLRDDA